jgi:FAD/FMN-containing dehydrogenase
MPRMTRRQAVGMLGALALPYPTKAPAAQPRLVMNDASGLNPTPVFRHWHVQADPETQLIEQLRRELKEAARERRPVCVGAARHSMGGQALARNGHAITLDLNQVEPDRARKLYRVHAGTRWHQVIAQLDPLGFSPAVMQSNHDFGVGATFAVNAHGWPTPFGPFGSTVRSLRMMLANGDIVTCSRQENPALFADAMGGYGLFGILLDLEVEMVENLLLEPRHEMMPAAAFAERFMAATHQPDVRMIYGRLNVQRDSFFQEALLVTYRPAPMPATGLPPASAQPGTGDLARRIYRAQIEREWGKSFRWWMEGKVAPKLLTGVATRNALMNEPVSVLRNRDGRRTDILHEYFVAPDRFNAFLDACRAILPKARAEFLNVTLRHVRQDRDSTLNYATTDRIAAVMSFSQRIEPRFEADMIATTEAMIDRVADLGGSFYLPYRLHARPEQLRRVYPSLPAFVARKRAVDPGLLFRNTMWDQAFASVGAAGLTP